MLVFFHPRAEKSLLDIPKKTRLAIVAEIGSLQAMDHPLQHRHMKKLQGAENWYRLRVGTYRVSMEFDGARLLILDIRNRQAGY